MKPFIIKRNADAIISLCSMIHAEAKVVNDLSKELQTRAMAIREAEGETLNYRRASCLNIAVGIVLGIMSEVASDEELSDRVFQAAVNPKTQLENLLTSVLDPVLKEKLTKMVKDAFDDKDSD